MTASRLASVAALVLAIVGWTHAGAQTSKSETPRLHLSWNAPMGMPRASDTLVASCNDTSRVDTLYLSYDFPGPAPAITALHASIDFRPQVGDTLGPFWSFKSGSANGGSLFIDFAPYQGGGCPLSWVDAGSYEVSYDRHNGGGRLDLSYYIEFEDAIGIDPGIRYCFARVRILHQRSHLSGCTGPAGVEWSNARFGHATGRKVVARAGETGVVRWNAGKSVDFGWARSTSLVKPWVPKSPKETGSGSKQ